MPSLFLPQYDAFVRWHKIGATGPVVVLLPGIGFPALGSFLATATDPAFPAVQSLMIDPLGAGQSDPVPGLSIPGHADAVAAVIDHLN